jgi:hypothetical protein
VQDGKSKQTPFAVIYVNDASVAAVPLRAGDLTVAAAAWCKPLRDVPFVS